MININNVEHDLANVSGSQLATWLHSCRNAFPINQDKKYQVIYMDPPWSYGSCGPTLQNQANAHYPTMSLNELKELPVSDIAAKESIVFMWISGPQLPKGIELLSHWGFDYKTIFKVWRKTNADGSPVCVPGWWSRSSTELVLVAARGNTLTKWKTSNNEPQEYASKRTGHSEKPDAIRDAIHDFLNVDNRIELFARKTVENWDAWGLEVPSFFYEGARFKSIGVQTDEFVAGHENIQVPQRPKGFGGVGNHKPNCQCFICKKKRTKALE